MKYNYLNIIYHINTIMEPNLVTNMEPNEDTIELNQDININTIDNDIMKTKISNTEKVELLFKPNSEGYSDFVSREEIDKSELKFTLNGNCRNGAYFGVNKYKWDVKRGKGRKVIALKLNGINDNKINGCSHPIGNHIKKYFKENMFEDGCVNCGTHSELCIDHKNDLYNDEKVLNVNTQQVYDFQYLCNHCNIVKREVCQKTKKTGKRYGATNIKKLKCFNIDFIVGDETFDETNPNAMVGTYWYDPVAFMEHINKMF
jgi:hypothetical protein